jgi:RNA polymerase sigma factor (TIGR02999 family)
MDEQTQCEVTRFVAEFEKAGGANASDLLPLVYAELRNLAAARLARERPDQTLGATALVHEAYMRLVRNGTPCDWDGKTHFFAAAAEAMRRILIEQARRKRRIKHGGGMTKNLLVDSISYDRDERLLALDEHLRTLEQVDPFAAKVVTLRFFGHLSHEQAAAALNTTVYQTRKKWEFARAWLRDAMQSY